MKEILGGKGAGLAEMTRIGLPVPAGFTISTGTCDYYLKHGKKYPKELAAQVKANLARLNRICLFGCEEYDDLKAAIEHAPKKG